MSESRGHISFAVRRLFHPQVVCAEEGGPCSRLRDAVLFLTQSLEREESFMRETGYPGYAAHKRNHEALLRKLGKMQRALACGAYDNAMVSGFLTAWIKSHTVHFDQPFGDFLRNAGRQPA